MRMSSIMRCRSGLMDWVDSVMALLLVSDEADCLSTEHKKQITSGATYLRSWIGAPLPRERFSPLAESASWQHTTERSQSLALLPLAARNSTQARVMRVRPLLSGLDAWAVAGYPVE